MKRKLLILTVMLPLILAMLFSCSIGDGGADGDSDSSDGGFKGTISLDNVMFTQTKTNEVPVVNTTRK
jgi:hypothetical protein